jgi:hypothetical protein
MKKEIKINNKNYFTFNFIKTVKIYTLYTYAKLLII